MDFTFNYSFRDDITLITINLDGKVNSLLLLIDGKLDIVKNGYQIKDAQGNISVVNDIYIEALVFEEIF